MAYCDACFKLTLSELWDNDVFFHPNLRSLQQSSDSGCPFCRICFESINDKAGWNRDHINALLEDRAPEGYSGEVWHPSLWLRGEFYSSLPPGDFEGSCVWLTCGKAPSYSQLEGSNVGGLGLSTRLSLFASEGSEAASQLNGRYSPAGDDPSAYIPLIRKRLQECHKEHPKCASRSLKEMPTRVITVGSAQEPACLVVTQGLEEPYVALSYCWGPAQNTLKLTEATWDDMLRVIEVGSLVKSHQQAIELTRALGFKYLWIDALCIVQGNAEDWASESRRMAAVYGNAALTIIAGRSADARQGFFLPASPSPRQNNDEDYGVPLGQSNDCVFYAGRPRSRGVGPTGNRGWCFQEKTLASRKITFGEGQLIYSCHTRTYFEDGCILWHENTYMSFLAFRAAIMRAGKVEDMLGSWYSSIRPFSACKLSNPHDVFAAFMSIAKIVQEFLGSRYLAGIWEKDIVRGLLWKPAYQMYPSSKQFKGPVTRPQPTAFVPGPIVRAPTWSWASIEGAVGQVYNARLSSQYGQQEFVKIRPVLGDGRWTENETCDATATHMPSCRLRFWGKTKRAAVVKRATQWSPDTKNLGKHLRFRWISWKKLGFLLSSVEVRKPAEEPDRWASALGVFDVEGEEEGVGEVSCLLLIPTEGLMIVRDGNDWKRVGWFSLIKPDWFEDTREEEISLV